MRIITEKDKRGLLVAIRTFLRAVNGERLSQSAGMPVIEKALKGGLTFDEILNKGNWLRASGLQPQLTFSGYIDILCDRKVPVLPIVCEPRWYEPENDFGIVAEAAHDFFQEVSGKGGKWNISSALTNIAKAIREHSLQAILSEDLIKQVLEKDPECNYFNFVHSIVTDFNSLNIDTSLSEEQEAALNTRENNASEQEADPAPAAEAKIQPEDEPYPEEEDLSFDDENRHLASFDSIVVTENNPNDMKKSCLKTVLENYTPNELLGLVDTIPDGRDLCLEEIITKFANGQFDPKKETTEAMNIHQAINSDLMLSFIDCVRIQGKEMDEEIAAQCDILHDSWDLRTPEVRKMHKLLRLIYTEGKEDPDLLDAVNDIEQMYAEK